MVPSADPDSSRWDQARNRRPCLCLASQSWYRRPFSEENPSFAHSILREPYCVRTPPEWAMMEGTDRTWESLLCCSTNYVSQDIGEQPVDSRLFIKAGRCGI